MSARDEMMAINTGIEWTDATWNLIVAIHKRSGKNGWFCTKPSQGCAHCYAEGINKRLGTRLPYTVGALDEIDIVIDEKKLDLPLRWKKPRRIFVNSMSDLFHESVPVEFIDRVFAVMAQAPHHTFQILTKRPERMRDYSCGFASVCPKRRSLRIRDSMYKGHPAEALVCGTSPAHVGNFPWPLPNVHLGVSVEDQPTADQRIPELLLTPAAVRFISYEPALGKIDIGPYGAGLDWVICGGESGPKARPMHPDWARSVRDQCVAAGVPFFFKQWGEWVPWATAGDDPSPRGTTCHALPNGTITDTNWNGGAGPHLIGSQPMVRFGKKKAGAVLDGREWREFPTAIETVRRTGAVEQLEGRGDS